MSPDNRPQSPEPGLLEEALLSAAGRLRIEPDALRWQVGERMDRRRSTLFRLTLQSSTGPRMSAYYKAPHFPDHLTESDSRHLERARIALARANTLGAQFTELARGTGIFLNDVLALNPGTLEVVTVGLEGRPMGNPAKYLPSRRRRTQVLEACGRVGRAVQLLEQLPAPHPDPERERIWSEARRKLEAAQSTFPKREVEELEELLSDLYQAALRRPRPVTYAHGDLSTENVLLMAGGTGLIDFMWVPQLRGFDLARFVHRLRHTTISFDPWIEALVEATLDGYGDQTAPEQPGWRFAELQRSLRTVLRRYHRFHWQRRPVRKALARIRSSL